MSSLTSIWIFSKTPISFLIDHNSFRFCFLVFFLRVRLCSLMIRWTQLLPQLRLNRSMRRFAPNLCLVCLLSLIILFSKAWVHLLGLWCGFLDLSLRPEMPSLTYRFTHLRTTLTDVLNSRDVGLLPYLSANFTRSYLIFNRSVLFILNISLP